MKNDETEPTLIKKKELARRLSISPRTLDEWTRKKLIPYHAITSRLYLYNFDEVLAVLKNRYHVEARR